MLRLVAVKAKAIIEGLPTGARVWVRVRAIGTRNQRGPWSDPIDLKVGRIDPGHIAGPDGRRYLFLSAGLMVPLADDGLSVTAEPKKVYDGWHYPEEWVVEGFAQEGPKILTHGGYYYMVLAEGGIRSLIEAQRAALDA